MVVTSESQRSSRSAVQAVQKLRRPTRNEVCVFRFVALSFARDAANKEVFNSRAARDLLSRDLPLASRAWTGGAAAQPLHQVFTYLPFFRTHSACCSRSYIHDFSGGRNLFLDQASQHHRHAPPHIATDVSTWTFPILLERCSLSAFPRRTI